MNGLTNWYRAFIFGAGAVGLGCVALQKHLNAQVIAKCNTSIYSVEYSKSSVGEVAHCVSRAAFYGPATPLKD
jgi:threonine dehydrogenase-like Zn-dependent dehydrogenase